VVTSGVTEEQISSELVLVDEALGRRARAALPDPPWLLPALAELRERPREERVRAPVEEPPAPPPDRRRRPSAGSIVLVLIALAFAGVTALAFVPQSHPPSFVKAPVDQSAPAAPVRPPAVTQPKAAAKPKTTPPRQTAKPRTTRQAPATGTRPKRRESRPARAPKPRTLTRAQRVVTWARYPAAVYYAVYIQRGSKTVFQTRTERTRALLPAHLAVKPGTYHLVVRPAIPNDAGITLGPATVRMKLKL
jgi:hypothetical protein